MPDDCQPTTPASSSTRRRRPATSGERGWLAAPWRASRRSRSGSPQRPIQRHQGWAQRPFLCVDSQRQLDLGFAPGQVKEAGSTARTATGWRCGHQTLEMRERRRVDEHQVLEASRHRRHPGQGRPVGQGHARARLRPARPPRRGRHRRRVARRRSRPVRHRTWPVPRHARPARGGAGHPRTAPAPSRRWTPGWPPPPPESRPADPPPGAHPVQRVHDLPRRPIAERDLALGVEPAPPLLGGRIRERLRRVRRPSRIELAQHDPGLDRPVPLVQLQLQRDVHAGRRARPPSARR